MSSTPNCFVLDLSDLPGQFTDPGMYISVIFGPKLLNEGLLVKSERLEEHILSEMLCALNFQLFPRCLLTQGCGGQGAAPTTGHTGSSCPHNLDTDTQAGSTTVQTFVKLLGKLKLGVLRR